VLVVLLVVLFAAQSLIYFVPALVSVPAAALAGLGIAGGL
jgi:hypothetical protein